MRAGTVAPSRVRRLGLVAAMISVALSLWLTAASFAVAQRSAVSQLPDPILHLAGPTHDGGGG